MARTRLEVRGDRPNALCLGVIGGALDRSWTHERSAVAGVGILLGGSVEGFGEDTNKGRVSLGWRLPVLIGR